jgi:cytochrome oxidase Cu insertion factor (SCO1/SenC/PrrC family)
MASGKRVLLMLLVLLGPGLLIYFISKTVNNHFIRLPYLGYEYKLDEAGNKIDSVAYHVPEFTLTSFNGDPITRDSIQGKIMILTTIQNECPDLKSCGLSLFHFNEIFFHKLVKNQDNYWNVRVLSILTDQNGEPIDSISPELREEMVQYDTTGIWWFATGDVTPFYDFNYYGKQFIDQPASNKDGEIGLKAFTNSLVLIDDQGHIRAVSGAKSDSDIRNFFDMVKLLKKEEFDANLAAEEQAS